MYSIVDEKKKGLAKHQTQGVLFDSGNAFILGLLLISWLPLPHFFHN
jgi:hypothetical protein